MQDSPGLETSHGKIDRRILRTRHALHDALYALIHEKGYDAVTVEEITQRAGVGRATFYLHYKDKEDLLLEQFSNVARDRVQLLAELPLTGWDLETNPVYLPLHLVFQNAAENAALYRVVLHGEGAARVTARLCDIIKDALSGVLQVQGDANSPMLLPQLPIDFIASYLAGAMIGTITWWLDQENPPDAVEITRTFQRIVFPGAALAFGIDLG